MLLFFSKPAQGVKTLIDDSFPCPWSAEICCVSVHSFHYCCGSRTAPLYSRELAGGHRRRVKGQRGEAGQAAVVPMGGTAGNAMSEHSLTQVVLPNTRGKFPVPTSAWPGLLVACC